MAGTHATVIARMVQLAKVILGGVLPQCARFHFSQLTGLVRADMFDRMDRQWTRSIVFLLLLKVHRLIVQR